MTRLTLAQQEERGRLQAEMELTADPKGFLQVTCSRLAPSRAQWPLESQRGARSPLLALRHQRTRGFGIRQRGHASPPSVSSVALATSLELCLPGVLVCKPVT